MPSQDEPTPSPGPSAYHRQVAAEKRVAIVEAAASLFTRSGYAGTSLAAVAAQAEVSRATLFRQFPTKAALFEAIVVDSWTVQDAAGQPETGDLRRGLVELGRRYVAVLSRPSMVDLFRTVIAEAPRFPELSRTHFDLGKLPFYDTVAGYLRAEQDAGTVRVGDIDVATTQFLGMVSNFVLWPRMLLVDWAPSDQATAQTVEEAALMMCLRYVPGFTHVMDAG